MRIALDVMGGDLAPVETVKGAILALEEIEELKMILVGNQDLIAEELKKYKYNKDRIKIIHTYECILNCEKESPAMAVRKKKNASMNIALGLVKEGEAQGCVSAGNTGALMSASLLKLGRIKGVLRPAIITVFPSKKENIFLLDVGANADCKPEYLEQFALMGSIYAKILLKKELPTIGLLNIGEEAAKGNELTLKTFELLEKNDKINFVGNIEAREMMDGNVNVVVTDGFTGNMVLKTAEGSVSLLFSLLKEAFTSNFISKLGAMLIMPALKKMKKKLDYSELGGALFLGLNGISIKSHGSSDGKAIKNGIKVAHDFAKQGFIDELKTVMKGDN